MEISIIDFFFWGIIEQDLKIDIPNHIKNNFNICGFNSGIVFKDIDDDDIKYVEEFTRTKIPELIEMHLKNNELFQQQKHSVCFFGEFSSSPLDFKYSVSEQWLIKQIVDHVNKIARIGTDGGLAHFQFSQFESKLNMHVKSIPFFSGEKIERQNSNNRDVIKKEKFEKPIILNKILCEAERHESRNKHGYRYNESVKEIASYWRMLGGKCAYESLQSNFLSTLPSVSTTNNFITKTDGYIVEGVLRSNELLTYLKSRGLPLVVSISEDATRICGRVQYDSKSNEIIGFVLPVDKQTGMPIPHSYLARNADEIFHHFGSGTPIAHFVNVIMAQPLADIPAFCLMVYGSDSKYTAEEVIKRWEYITKTLLELNIIVLTNSSDSDPKFNSAMRKTSLLGMKSCIIDADWFNSGAKIDSLPFNVQDTPHIGTKLRNAFLATGSNKNKFLFGNKFSIQLDHVKYIMNNFPKDQHELTPTVINADDRQNFTSVLRMCDKKVTMMMKKYVQKSDATVAFLELLRDIIESYKDINLKPLERVEKIWYAVFVFRIWREFVLSRDDLTLKDNFLTMNCYSCIEINAHSLIMLMLYLKETNQPHLFMTHLFESQPCEKFFRQLRSYTTVYSTVANCSVKEILGRIKQIQLQNDIANRSVFNFPRAKIPYELNKSNVFELPTKEEIIEKIEQCKRKAIDFAVKIKLMKKMNVKSFVFGCKIPPIEPKNLSTIADNILEEKKEKNDLKLTTIHLKNFAAKFDGEEISEKSPYVRVMCDGSKEFVIKKTSFCWLLRQEQVKLSSDRLLRVRANCKQYSK